MALSPLRLYEPRVVWIMGMNKFFVSLSRRCLSRCLFFSEALFYVFICIQFEKVKRNRNLSLMPRRSRNNQEKFLWKTPTSPCIQPSLFFNDYDLEFPLVEHPENFEEPIEEEEVPTSPIQVMDDNINQGVFPIRQTNGETKMKNIRPSTPPWINF